MEIQTAHLTYITDLRGDEYETTASLVSKPLSNLENAAQYELLNYALNCFNQTTVESVLAQNNYFAPEKIKEAKGISFSNKDSVCFEGEYSLNSVSLGEKISDYMLSKMGNEFYVKIEPPKEIQDQLDAYQQRLAQKKAQDEEKKKARKIKKAEKLLKEAGKI